MECVATSETTDLVIVVDVVDADGASIARAGEKFVGGGGLDGIVVIVFPCRGRGRRGGLGGSDFGSVLVVRLVRIVLVLNGDRASKIFGVACGIRLSLFVDDVGVRVGGEGLDLGRHSFQHCFLDASGSTGGSGYATGGRQALLFSSRPPRLVFCEREALVDLVHRHQLLLSSPSRARHGGEVDWFSGFCIDLGLTVSLVVPEAVFNSNDNPASTLIRRAEQKGFS